MGADAGESRGFGISSNRINPPAGRDMPHKKSARQQQAEGGGDECPLPNSLAEAEPLHAIRQINKSALLK